MRRQYHQTQAPSHVTPQRRNTTASSTYSNVNSSFRAPSSVSTPSTTKSTPRRRPAWNEYLTDSAQYKLSQEQQLQRQLQHLSTAHFASRSPLPSHEHLYANRRQRVAMAATPTRQRVPQTPRTPQRQRGSTVRFQLDTGASPPSVHSRRSSGMRLAR